MDDKIKVLIVDDAAFMRKTIRKILETEEQISIIGTAKNGQEAVKMNSELLPDVITLDIDMPVMDGITALKHMMVQRPVPVVVVSSLSYETDVTFEAFRLGIIDFIPKPTGAISKELEKQKAYLCQTVKDAAMVKNERIRRVAIGNRKPCPKRELPPAQKIFTIGSSLGGPNSIIRISYMLPRNIDFAIITIMQISAKVMESFIQKLDKISRIKVNKGRREDILRQGEMYLHALEQPPPNIMQKDAEHFVLKYSQDPCATPIDAMLESAAAIERLDAGCVLLGGTGQDGINGLEKMHHRTGKTIVQRAPNAVFPDKTKTAIQKSIYRHAVNDHEIADTMVKMMSSS